MRGDGVPRLVDVGGGDPIDAGAVKRLHRIEATRCS
jgi:hypothetical protein